MNKAQGRSQVYLWEGFSTCFIFFLNFLILSNLLSIFILYPYSDLYLNFFFLKHFLNRYKLYIFFFFLFYPEYKTI